MAYGWIPLLLSPCGAGWQLALRDFDVGSRSEHRRLSFEAPGHIIRAPRGRRERSSERSQRAGGGRVKALAASSITQVGIHLQHAPTRLRRMGNFYSTCCTRLNAERHCRFAPKGANLMPKGFLHPFSPLHRLFALGGAKLIGERQHPAHSHQELVVSHFVWRHVMFSKDI